MTGLSESPVPSVVLVGLALVIGALGAWAAATGDYLSLALLILAPIAPFAAVAAVRAVRGEHVYALGLAVLVIVIESANFRYREYADKTIDFQVALKLAGIVLLVVLSVPTLLRRVQTGLPAPVLLWFLFLSYLVFTSTYAVNSTYSLIASASTLGGFCFLFHLLDTYGAKALRWVLVASGLVLSLASIAAYVAVPSFGRMSDWVGNAFVVTSRLQGVFGSSNAAGVSGAFCLLLTLVMLDIRRRTFLFWIMVGAFTFCLVMSNNRMAIAAAGFAFGIIFMTHGHLGRRSIVALLAAAAMVAVLLFAGEAILERLARSGSSEEVLSATGRTRIWAVVLELWGAHPLFGLGYASAQQILPEDPRLFVAAAHAHNMYLEVLFSGGLLGLGLFVASLASTLALGLRRRAFKELALVAFFLLYGMTEPIISSVIGFPSVAFLAAVLFVFAREPAGSRDHAEPAWGSHGTVQGHFR